MGVEPDGGDWVPVSDAAGPAFRVVLPSVFVDALPVFQDLLLSPEVSVVRSDEPDGAVQVLGIVPRGEAVHPRLGVHDVFKGLSRIFRPILQGPEQRFGKRVVVTDSWAREGRHDAEPLERGEHGRALHRATVIGMQDQSLWAHAVCQTRGLEQLGGSVHGFLLEHAGRHDSAAPDVQDQVQIDKLTSDRRGKIGDVPGPHLVGTDGREFTGAVVGCRFCALAVSRHVFLPQNSIQSGLGRQIYPLVGQQGDDLLGRKASVFRRINDLDNALLFSFRQSVGWRRVRSFASILAVDRIAPAKDGLPGEAEGFGGLVQTSAGGHCFVDQGDSRPPVLWAVPDSPSPQI